MLEQKVRAQATANLEYTLACFEVDRRGAVKKTKDVSFDPLPATSSFEVKTDQPPLRSGITCDECAKVISIKTNYFEINMHVNLSKFMDSHNKGRKRDMQFLFLLMTHMFVDRPQLLANLNIGCC